MAELGGCVTATIHTLYWHLGALDSCWRPLITAAVRPGATFALALAAAECFAFILRRHRLDE